VLDHSLLEQTIQLSNVRRYAYGQFKEGGGVGIWAEGKAGWFLVEPAVEYKAIFAEMVEAIGMLYFLADNSKKSGTRRGGYRGSKGTDEQCQCLFRKASRILDYSTDGMLTIFSMLNTRITGSKESMTPPRGFTSTGSFSSWRCWVERSVSIGRPHQFTGTCDRGSLWACTNTCSGT